MHIADVRTIPLSYHCETPYMSAAGVQTARHALLVEVETDNGLVGIGEAGSAGGPLVSTQVVVEHELKPLLLGEDPLRLEYLLPAAGFIRRGRTSPRWWKRRAVISARVIGR